MMKKRHANMDSLVLSVHRMWYWGMVWYDDDDDVKLYSTHVQPMMVTAVFYGHEIAVA